MQMQQHNLFIRVVENIKAVTDTAEQISHASSQQSNAINQVTLGIDQISSVVQTNSATAQESAAASEELSGQAQMMKALVGSFTLSGEKDELNFNNQTDYQQDFESIDSKY